MQNSIENLTDTADIAKTVLANLDSIEPKELQDAVKYLIYENSILKESRELGEKVVDMLMSKLQNTIDISKLSRTDHIKKLIAELKTCTANKYELHRVEVLERDLLEGLPVVEVLDDTRQKFQGKIFRTCKTSNHFNTNASIHRNVYNYYLGIPENKSYVIHHINNNPADNSIENLALMTEQEHRILHKRKSEEQLREYICIECGKKFTAQNFSIRKYCSKKCYITAKKRAASITKICEYCGKEFSSSKYLKQRFCSTRCALSKPPIKKICPICHKEFLTKKPKKITCSATCATRLAHKTYWSERKAQPIKKICPICHKEFLTSPTKRGENKTCSRSCASKLSRQQDKPKSKEIEKVCPVCGKKFITKANSKERKTCSTDCWHKLPKNTRHNLPNDNSSLDGE